MSSDGTHTRDSLYPETLHHRHVICIYPDPWWRFPKCKGDVIQAHRDLEVKSNPQLEETMEKVEIDYNAQEDTEYLPTSKTTLRAGHPMFHELLDQIRRTHAAKAKDYGAGHPLGNFMATQEMLNVPAAAGIMVRMTDKWTRLCNIFKAHGKHAVKDETVEDTALDLAVYSILLVIILRETGYLSENNQSS